MNPIEIIFWICVAIVFYAFLGYGILLYALVKLKRLFTKSAKRYTTHFEPLVTLVIPCYNEQDILAEKIANCKKLDYPSDKLKLVFITDGSTDGSESYLAAWPEINVLHESRRAGKTAAENRVMKYVDTPFVIFSDANTMLNTAAVREIVKHFADEKVGCVSGEKKIISEASDSASAAGEGIYWKYESFLKKLDSELYSAVGAAGELVAFRDVDIYAKVSGFIKSLNVDVGSEVKQGQLLALAEAPELSAQLSSAESRLKAQEAVSIGSKANYERVLEASKFSGAVSKNDVDLALAKRNADLAQLEAAKSAYREVADLKKYLEIRAPFNGIISARNVSAGAYVGPSGKGSEFPLFTLVEQRKLRLVVSVPEAYSSYLQGKSEVNFKVKSLQNQNFHAKVSRLAGALDTRLRSQRVEMDVPNNDRKLLPGMIAEVSIPLNSATSSFVVPRSSVLNSTQGTFLIKVADEKATWIPVKTGTTSDDKTEVFGDVKEGDVFIKTVTEEIRDNSTIKNLKTTGV